MYDYDILSIMGMIEGWCLGDNMETRDQKSDLHISANLSSSSRSFFANRY